MEWDKSWALIVSRNLDRILWADDLSLFSVVSLSLFLLSYCLIALWTEDREESAFRELPSVPALPFQTQLDTSRDHTEMNVSVNESLLERERSQSNPHVECTRVSSYLEEWVKVHSTDSEWSWLFVQTSRSISTRIPFILFPDQTDLFLWVQVRETTCNHCCVSDWVFKSLKREHLISLLPCSLMSAFHIESE